MELRICQACGLRVPQEAMRRMGQLEVCCICYEDAHESLQTIQDIALEEIINSIVKEAA